MRTNVSRRERLLIFLLFSWAELHTGLRNHLRNRVVPVNANGWYWRAGIPVNFRVFLKELSAFSFQKLILLLMLCAKMLKHHLEYIMVRKCHLLFWPLVCTSLYYLTRLYFNTLFRRSHVNLPQETGTFKNKNLPRLFNAGTPSVALEIHNSWVHRCWESVLGKYHSICTLAILLFSRYLLEGRDEMGG